MAQKRGYNNLKNRDDLIVGSTSLPPKIDGQLRGYVVLEIPFFRWTLNKVPHEVYIKVLWWGEEGDGTVFRPSLDKKIKQSKKLIRAIYGIRSGPKQFKDYLSDMKSMHLTVFDATTSSLIGEADVKQLSSLSRSRPITGMFPVFARQNKKIAEVKVLVSIESVQSTSDALNDIPTPDGGLHYKSNLNLFDLNELFDSKQPPLTNNTNNIGSKTFPVVGAIDEVRFSTGDFRKVSSVNFDEKLKNGHIDEGLLDSLLSSVSQLRNKMTASTLKTTIDGSYLDGDIEHIEYPPFDADDIFNSSQLNDVESEDFILESMAGIGKIERAENGFHGLNPDDAIEDEYLLQDIFYKNVVDEIDSKFDLPDENGSPVKVKNLSGIKKKQKVHVEQIPSGIVVQISKLFLTNKTFAKQKSIKRNSSSFIFSLSVRCVSPPISHKLVVREIQQVVGKFANGVIEFNQKIMLSREMLCKENASMEQMILLMEVSEKSSAFSKPKLLGTCEFFLSKLFSGVEHYVSERLDVVQKNQKSALLIGQLEAEIQLLFDEEPNQEDTDGERYKEIITEGLKTIPKDKSAASDRIQPGGFQKECLLHAYLVVPFAEVFHSKSPSLSDLMSTQHLKKSSNYEITLDVRSPWNENFVTTGSSINISSSKVAFNFYQITPVALTSDLLERMKGKSVVIEVRHADEIHSKKNILIGITKLSVNPFFQAFHSEESTSVSLNSTFPVVATDGSVPIVCPFTKAVVGSLQAVLAMGAYSQVVSLQSFKVQTFPEMFPSPEEHQIAPPMPAGYSSMADSEPVEHRVEIRIVNILRLKSKDIKTGKDIQCYVQFLFPSHQSSHTLPPDELSLKLNRTSSVTCLPDVYWDETFQHFIYTSHNTSIHQLISNAYFENGLQGEITFEVWCRVNRPTVCDRLVAKGVLSLEKFFKTITKKSANSSQSSREFSVDLRKCSFSEEDRVSSSTALEFQSCGILTLIVNHSLTAKTSPNAVSINPINQSSNVNLSVVISKACGLKYACERIAAIEPRLKLHTLDGLNVFLSLSLSLGGQQQNVKTTRMIQNTFRPDFDSHFEFSCPLMWSEGQSRKPVCLAELLETARLEIHVYHQNLQPNTVSWPHETMFEWNKILIGKVHIPLENLLVKSTGGLRGWFPIELVTKSDLPNRSSFSMIPSTTYNRRETRHVANVEDNYGGIEVFAKFLNETDLESLFESAEQSGWSPPARLLRLQRSLSDGRSRVVSVQLKIDSLSFSLGCIEDCVDLPMNSLTRCYLRMKFFDENTRISELFRLNVDNGVVYVNIVDYNQIFHVHLSSTFSWYLTEEKLEIQAWLNFEGKGDKELPHEDDKLIGSAFVDLLEFNDFSRREHIASGRCPLYNPSSESMGHAFLHYTLHMMDVSFNSHDNETKVETKIKEKEEEMLEKFNEEDYFRAHVSIERAYHLPSVSDRSSGQVNPSPYVTYQTASSEKLNVTSVVENDRNPVWSYETDVWLSRELLTNEEKSLIFKVWHKVGKKSNVPDKFLDKVVGFVSVNLRPLMTKEFYNVSGFYNIIDFNCSPKGQIKISVIPLEMMVSPASMMANIPPSSFDHYVQSFKQGPDEFSPESILKSITNSLEKLTTNLKCKMAQSFDLEIPSKDSQKEQQNLTTSNKNHMMKLIDRTESYPNDDEEDYDDDDKGVENVTEDDKNEANDLSRPGEEELNRSFAENEENSFINSCRSCSSDDSFFENPFDYCIDKAVYELDVIVPGTSERNVFSNDVTVATIDSSGRPVNDKQSPRFEEVLQESLITSQPLSNPEKLNPNSSSPLINLEDPREEINDIIEINDGYNGKIYFHSKDEENIENDRSLESQNKENLDHGDVQYGGAGRIDVESIVEETPESHVQSFSSTDVSSTTNATVKEELSKNWISDHKRKVHERIVAFKTFKIPSVEQSQRIAKILTSKLKN